MANALYFPDVGLKYLTEVVVGKRSVESIKVVPFTNDVTQAAGNVIGDFSQMSNHGISAKTLTGASWSAATVASAEALTAYAAQAFLATAADAGTATTVYGIVVYSATTNIVLWSIKFDPSKGIENENDSVTYTPELSQKQKA